jgi:hypothetical protein
MRQAPLVLPLVLVALAVFAPAAPAGADEPAKPAPAACTLKGTFPVARGTAIFDAASAGRTLATFTGAYQGFTITELPADPSNARARIATSAGAPSLRVEGWIAPGAMAFFTTRDLPVVPGHVWISDAQRVRLVQAGPGSLGVELSLPGTSGQSVRATAPCDGVAVSPGTPTPMSVPGDGRGFLSKTATIDLFGEPGGAVVFTLRGAEGTAQLFWSNEARAGFVHVKMRGSLTIDAWARQRDLEPLKKGEMMDQFIPPVTSVAAATLKLDGAPRLVKADKDMAVRAKREEKDKPIGMVEAGAEIFVLETMLGFTNVLPKNLGLFPGEDGGFWVPSAEVPKG